ncbi:MAG: hypothetical protein QOE08_727 [Thermoleophilaceae bacterium]|nr:hypothetical protein [Thermoleophilaceae bacterium]
MTFTRLGRGDLLAAVAALALLFVMAMDWYTTKEGQQIRDDSKLILPQLNNEVTPSLKQQAESAAQKFEKNAWQAHALIDRLILLAMLAAIVLALAAAVLQAADRRDRARRVSALTSFVALAAFVLIAYRIFQPPGLNDAAVVKAGAPLALLCTALITIGARIATISDRRREGEAPGEPDEPAPTIAA